MDMNKEPMRLFVQDTEVLSAIKKLTWVTGVGLGLIALILWWAV